MRRVAALAVFVPFLLVGASASLAYSTRATTDLMLRTGPGTQFGAITVIPGGAWVDARACGAGWCDVIFGNRRGFVSARFLSPPPRGAAPFPPPPPPGAGAPPPPRFPPPRWPGTTPLACDARGALWARGQFASASGIEQARGAAGARTVRVIRPGEAVTLEHNPQRLNIEVDPRNRIVNLRCG